MSIEFDWDPVKAASNAVKHGVTFQEAMTIFLDPFARTIFDRIMVPTRSVGSPWAKPPLAISSWLCTLGVRGTHSGPASASSQRAGRIDARRDNTARKIHE
jgi:Ribonuclease toxin, BrnT, of type II toxin-antitoxin system